MKSIRKSLAFYSLTALLSLTHAAGAMVDYACPSPFYFRVEAGGSFPRCLEICANPAIWDPAQEGYNAKPDHAPLVGAGVGYNINQWLSIGASANYRGFFEYCKYQTPTDQADTTPGFLGVKTRRFDLENTSFMVDLFLNRTGSTSYYSYNFLNMCLAPYFGVSIGWARNVLYNFHSIRAERVTVGDFTTNSVNSIMPYYIKNEFAWQVALGADFMINNCLGVGLGYRYFDANCFRTNDHNVDIWPGFNTPVRLTPWTGKLRCHEVVGSMNIAF